MAALARAVPATRIEVIAMMFFIGFIVKFFGNGTRGKASTYFVSFLKCVSTKKKTLTRKLFSRLAEKNLHFRENPPLPCKRRTKRIRKHFAETSRKTFFPAHPLGFKPRARNLKISAFFRFMDAPKERIRLQKFLSQAEICSRRAAEKLIADGEVTVNGHVAELG